MQTMRINRVAPMLVALLLVAASPMLSASDDPSSPRILVSGEGSVDLTPDMAVLLLTVTRAEETARAALDANSKAMSEVLEAMQEQGIAQRDLQTSNFSIQPRYNYPKRNTSGTQEAPRIVGYTVRNSLSVRVRDITAVGEILDKAVTLGVNEGGNIQFTNSDPAEAITRARVLAVQEAQATAKTLAEAAGVKTGEVLEISEQSHRPRPVAMSMARAERAMANDSVPVAAGQNSYRVTVTMAVAIKQ